jgi:hypothetical protein
MNFPPVPGSARILKRRHVKFLEEKISVTYRLTDTLFQLLSLDETKFLDVKVSVRGRFTEALFEYLTIDIKHDLETIAAHPQNPLETMNAIQESIERTQARKEQFEKLLAPVREKLPEMADMLALAFIEPINQELDFYRRTLSEAQAAAEKEAKG